MRMFVPRAGSLPKTASVLLFQRLRSSLHRAALWLALGSLALPVAAASPGYAGWRRTGSIFINTTREGANLPAAALVRDFPVLVRLNRDFFDFSQAKAGGEDLRCSTIDGAPLAYQIEEWDAARGVAGVWVRVPVIHGDASQEIKLYWGNRDATPESSGRAVFNESNGFLSVWHMSDPVRDDAGSVSCADTGTTPVTGVIGPARHFSGGHGVSGGESITNYPAGAGPQTSEAWVRAERSNGRILGWGNEAWQGKVVMSFRSPPHISMDCYFSDANVESQTRLPIGEWIHVVHTYEQGEARIYINGALDGVSKRRGSPLNVKSPARLYLGGWYDDYDFVGDIDEARISKVARSADWIRLEYENQKPMQTLTGPLVAPGDEFSISASEITVAEGASATIAARAAGAWKIYWILKRVGRESVVAVDCLGYTFNAGRVVGDESATLQLKVVYPDGVRTKDVAIRIKEEIEEPVFALKAPGAWDGREAIEVVPVVANIAAMQARGAGALKYRWAVSGPATTRDIASDRLVLRRAEHSGPLTVTLGLDNGGAETVRSVTINVKEPAADWWVRRAPARDEKPVDNQFYARDDKEAGTLYCNGTLAEAADTVFLRLYAGDKLLQTISEKPANGKTYSLTAAIKAGLIRYRVEFGSERNGRESLLHTATNLVCGDAYIIQGQSNALATDTGETAPPYTNEWIRTYGSTAGDPDGARLKLWGNAVWKDRHGERLQLGYWGMELAKRLVESEKIPVCILNGAVGGTRIDQHQRNGADPEDVSTIYGRLLWRVRQARLTHGIRGVLWHQGENDQGADGPTGGLGWETYREYFIAMAGAWKQDYPNIQHYYVFQIWPKACEMGVNGSDNMLREVQRTLPALYSRMSVMSTLGIKPYGGCHYPLPGWAEFARLIQPLIERDFYGKTFGESITPPNLVMAAFTNGTKDEVALEFDQAVIWKESLATQCYLDGRKGQVASGSVAGSVLTLKLNAPSSAREITYLDSRAWSPTNLLVGANGIAALTFCHVALVEK